MGYSDRLCMRAGVCVHAYVDTLVVCVFACALRVRMCACWCVDVCVRM